MLYFVLGVIIGLLLLVLWSLKKLLVMVNEIKKYQYTNNLKLVGFIKKLAKIKGDNYVNKRNTF